MTFERVNFNEEVIKQMTADEFIEKHVEVLWLDRSEDTRRKMLGEVYKLIAKPAGKTKKKSND